MFPQFEHIIGILGKTGPPITIPPETLSVIKILETPPARVKDSLPQTEQLKPFLPFLSKASSIFFIISCSCSFGWD